MRKTIKLRLFPSVGQGVSYYITISISSLLFFSILISQLYHFLFPFYFQFRHFCSFHIVSFCRTSNPLIPFIHSIRTYHPYIPSVHSIYTFHPYIPSVHSTHNQLFTILNLLMFFESFQFLFHYLNCILQHNFTPWKL